MTPPMLVRGAALWIALAGVALLYGGAFFDPPYWDALLGAFPQGLWLARNDFDGVRLLTQEKGYIDGGPSVYPFSAYPYAVGALYAAGLAPRAVFAVMHAASLVSAAAVAASLYRIVAARSSNGRAPLAVGLASALAVYPLFGAMASQINMDMPLTACSLLASEALLAKRYGRAAAWNALALLVKPTGVIAVAAGALTLFLTRERRARGFALVHVGLLLVFVLQLQLLRAYDQAPPYVSLFGGLAQLARTRLWVIPEYGLAFVAFLLALPLVLRRVLSATADPCERVVVVFLATFAAFYAQVDNTLPRYFLQSLPYFAVGIALLVERGRARPAALRVAWAAAIAFGVVNRHGVLYPQSKSDWEQTGGVAELPRNDGFLLERSLAYQDDLELDLAVARALDPLPRDATVIVANWPLVHALAFAEFGYVDRAFRVCSPDQPLTFDARGVRWSDLYAESGGARKPSTQDDVLWVVTPNVFSSPETRLRPGDEVLHAVEHAGHRAFVLRRADGE